MSDAPEAAQSAQALPEDVTSLLDEITVATGIKDHEAKRIARRGVQELLANLVSAPVEKIDKALIDAYIAEIDVKLSAQIDEILHHEDVQKLESAWRGLKFVVDQTNFRENIKIDVLNVSKDELLEDFENSPEIPKSGLYQHIYTDEFGQAGGEPFGAMVANYEFGPSPRDVALAQKISAVSAMSHCPFIAAAGKEMFGVDDFRDLPKLKDLASVFEGPQYTKWNSFRDSPDSRYFGLTMPRFLLRHPYDPDANPVKAFNYEENVIDDHRSYLWGNAAFAFATRLTDSFASSRWTMNCTGPQAGGMVENLILHQYKTMEGIETKIPTEVLISDRREFELAESGFIGLTMYKKTDQACFFSANSAQKPKTFPDTAEGQRDQTNYKLGTRLPYMMIISRLAHYLKVIQRDNLQTWQSPTKMQTELTEWMRQYAADMDNPTAEVANRRPIRKFSINVSEVPGEVGFYKVDLQIMPHIKFEGANFTLSLVGKLDKE
ncbi:MAG: type VI secretion system contractile sheath large subunit [Planctomycetes bacterium]|nr:type VI secretion system contractile sheath large subunit [Planctomycetota bacterium]